MGMDTLPNDVIAQHALAVMYAWDMCDANRDARCPDPDPRVPKLRFGTDLQVVAIITGVDDLIGSGPDSIRQNQIRAGSERDRRRYGYVADNGETLFAVIRGTDGAEEWFDDFVFVAKEAAPDFAGRVEEGFLDIYNSLKLWPINQPTEAVDLVDGLRVLAGTGRNVRVLGHSLGSALGTLLTSDLSTVLGKQRVSALLFASPKVGDHDFVTQFAARVEDYLVINYEHDLVPRVPPFDIFCMDLYRTLPKVRMLTDETAAAVVNGDKACCHHLICYVAMLSPSVYRAAMAATAPLQCTKDDVHCAQCVVQLR
jgi:pimeloyl-ACP methyl ester carboxylesterase